MVALGVEPEAALQRPATLAPRFGGVAVGAHLLVDLARALQLAHGLRDSPSCPAQSGMGALSSLLVLWSSAAVGAPFGIGKRASLLYPPCPCLDPPAAARRVLLAPLRCPEKQPALDP